MKAGDIISRYRIVGELGRGGMGVVYKAEDAGLDRVVALKLLPPQAIVSEDLRARFYREARAAGSLNHPNIAHVYEIDESVVRTETGSSEGGPDASPRPFIAMEYIDGQTLADRIADGPLPLTDAVSIGIQIAAALGAAHDRTVVHRDVKSGNIMLTSAGVPKILDFGLALTAASTRLTQMGSTIGTAAYMSPEQAKGEEVDHRTDLWSLGVILYEMISGRLPFPGDYEQAVVYGILNSDPEPLTAVRTAVPMDVERIVSKLLSKDRTKRYQSTADLIVDLEAVKTEAIDPNRTHPRSNIGAPPPAMVRTPEHRVSRWIWPAFVVTACLAAAVGWLLPRPASERPLRKYQVTVANLGESAISPDGEKIAFAAGGALWLRELSDLNVRRLVDAAGVDHPFWSPDGQQIGFVMSGSLFRIPATGGTPTMICELPFGAFGRSVWLNEGSVYFMVFTGAGLSEVFSAPAQGGNPRLFLRSADDPGVYSYRDIGRTRDHGAIIVSVVRIGGQYETEFMSVTPDGVRRSLFVLESGQAAGPVYSPTGHLLYSVDDAIWAAPIASSGESAGEPFRIVSNADAPSVSSNGDLLYRSAAIRPGESVVPAANSSTASSGELVWVDRTGALLETAGVLGENPADPVVSPDGARVVVSYDRELWLHSGGRDARTRLTFSEGSAFSPRWTAGKNELVFVTLGAGQGDISVLELGISGRAYDLLATPKPDFHAEISPDGEYLVFYRIDPDTNRDIVLARLDRSADSLRIVGEVEPLIRTPFDEAYPAISPDGRFIAYHANRTGVWEIYLSQFPGGLGEWPVSTQGGRLPHWNPEGGELFYVDPAGNLVAVLIESSVDEPVIGDPKVLFSGAPFGHSLSAPSLHNSLFGVGPSGDRFIVIRFNEATRYEALTVVENWYAEFKQQ